MATQSTARGLWMKLPILLRAVVSGLLIALVAANVWPALLFKMGAPLAAVGEAIFLTLYVWWAAGGGPPRTSRAVRAESFRRTKLSARQWSLTLMAAFFFAATVHASIVLLFRFIVFPVGAFRQGYDFSFIPSPSLKWLVVVFSAMSAGVCEETGFRGYMQQPMEVRYRPSLAILVSSLLFTAVHLTKGWALAGMVPIVFGAGVLLGLLAWSSGSLLPGIIGHVLMDVGLFAYWWTGIAGTFTARPITETGVDRSFLIACVSLAASLLIVLLAASWFRKEAVAQSD
jgi:membrane protease YdiL (CAAX protease family)